MTEEIGSDVMVKGSPRTGVRKTDKWYREQGLVPPPRYRKPESPEGTKRKRRTAKWWREQGLEPPVRGQIPPAIYPQAFQGADRVVSFPSGNTLKQMHPIVQVEPPHHKPETDEEIDARITSRFEVLSTLTDAAISGEARALIVSGPPGLGKSYLVEEKLREYDPNELNHIIVKGKALATGLFKQLYAHREAGQIVVFDDCDVILFQDEALNLLKAACDTSEVRRISWLTEAALFDDETQEPIPKRFEFEGTVIFITNIDFDYLIGRGHARAPHLKALMSRAHYIDMSMKTARDCLVRIRQIWGKGLTTVKGISIHQEKEVLDFIEENLDTLREVSLRTAVKIANIVKKRNLKGDWRKVAKVTCCRQ